MYFWLSDWYMWHEGLQAYLEKTVKVCMWVKSTKLWTSDTRSSKILVVSCLCMFLKLSFIQAIPLMSLTAGWESAFGTLANTESNSEWTTVYLDIISTIRCNICYFLKVTIDWLHLKNMHGLFLIFDSSMTLAILLKIIWLFFPLIYSNQHTRDSKIS